MHIQGSKLYSTIITGQVLWDTLMFPNGLNLSEVSPSLMFLLSTENFGYKLSNDFRASPSVGWFNIPSLVRPSTCHLM